MAYGSSEHHVLAILHTQESPCWAQPGLLGLPNRHCDCVNPKLQIHTLFHKGLSECLGTSQLHLALNALTQCCPGQPWLHCALNALTHQTVPFHSRWSKTFFEVNSPPWSEAKELITGMFLCTFAHCLQSPNVVMSLTISWVSIAKVSSAECTPIENVPWPDDHQCCLASPCCFKHKPNKLLCSGF